MENCTFLVPVVDALNVQRETRYIDEIHDTEVNDRAKALP